jgi:hypothetical protein
MIVALQVAGGDPSEENTGQASVVVPQEPQEEETAR